MIRLADLKDLPAITDIISANCLYLPNLQHSHQKTWVKVMNDDLVGVIAWQIVLDQAELLVIAVKESFRRQKIAQDLLCFSESFLQKQMVGRCFLEVRDSNLVAQNFYKNSGYQLISYRKNYYGREKAQIWAKTLF